MDLFFRASSESPPAAGDEVRIAHDGQEAWEMIQEDLPDVLVTDVQMPRVDGFELSRRIRGNDATKDLPILMLTAKGFELEQQDKQAILLFSHYDWQHSDAFIAHCSTKWGVFMMSIKACIETGVGSPYPDDVAIDFDE